MRRLLFLSLYFFCSFAFANTSIELSEKLSTFFERLEKKSNAKLITEKNPEDAATIYAGADIGNHVHKVA